MLLQTEYSEENERLKRMIRKKFQEFPKITFIIYITFALANFILMGYLLTLNYDKNNSFVNYIIIWTVFLLNILLFIINSILFTLKFSYKKIILGISIIVQTILASASIILANSFGHISQSDQIYFYMSQALNIFTTICGFIPLYLVY